MEDFEMMGKNWFLTSKIETIGNAQNWEDVRNSFQSTRSLGFTNEEAEAQGVLSGSSNASQLVGAEAKARFGPQSQILQYSFR